MKPSKVLIACQSDCSASMLSDLFHGAEVVETVSGMIRQLRDRSFHVLVLEEEIERLTAIDLVPIIRRINPKVQIVAISSQESIESARQLRQAGIFYHAIKPIDVDEIKSAVSCALKKIEREEMSGIFFPFLEPSLLLE